VYYDSTSITSGTFGTRSGVGRLTIWLSESMQELACNPLTTDPTSLCRPVVDLTTCSRLGEHYSDSWGNYIKLMGMLPSQACEAPWRSAENRNLIHTHNILTMIFVRTLPSVIYIWLDTISKSSIPSTLLNIWRANSQTMVRNNNIILHLWVA
jgi:hypothetical protein